MVIYKNYRLSRMINIQDLVSADYFHGRHPQTRMHSHPNAWEMCVCMEGSIQIVKNGYRHTLNAGDLTFIHPQTLHEIISSHRENAAFIISFTCNGELLRPLQDTVVSITDEIMEYIHKLIYELKISFIQFEGALRITEFLPREDAPLCSEQMICTYLEQLLILVLREITMHKGKTTATGQLREAMHNYLIEQVMAYIREHSKENLSVSDIAAYFHYSRTHLSTLFKSITGVSIGEYVVFVRIRNAKALLLEQKMTIAQIAEETGFSSPQYFSHRFSKEVGCSPSQFVERVAHPDQDAEKE